MGGAHSREDIRAWSNDNVLHMFDGSVPMAFKSFSTVHGSLASHLSLFFSQNKPICLCHLLPMVDIGRLLAQRGVIVTIVTTPHNAGRVQKSIARSIESGHPIRLVQLQFPGKEF
ncbi:hypothetical protein V6N11_082610 [Hibiscus sabdariffa]|uniref:Uncharacterized protein n=1 Tax=Hibiscus sabdariffa TaxID=183260 RepID=A0ABR1ZA19_9ROSI